MMRTVQFKFAWSAFVHLAVILLVPLMASARGSDKVGKKDLESWIKGPIHYIITVDEIKTFRALSSDEDRAFFIERFWSRRDPTPDTMVNEYRELFWQRVKEANDTIIDSPKPGWKTDRGKIYILYGPPSEIRDIPNLETDSSPTSGRGLIRWIYHGRPGDRTDMDPITVVPFARDMTGEYRLSYDPKLASVFFDELAIREKRTQRFESFLANSGAPPLKSRLSVMLDLGKMQEVPPHEQVLIEHVETMEAFATESIEAQVDRFRHPHADGTLTSVTIHFPSHRLDSKPAIMARFTRRDDETGIPVILGEGSFRFIQTEDDGLMAQGRTNLAPGTWDLLVITVDPEKNSAGIYRQVIVSVATSDGLAISDVVLASRLDPLSVAALASYDEPFHLGTFNVIPMAGRSFKPGDYLRLFYEIYGGEQPYRVSYHIDGMEEDGSWVALFSPAPIEQALGAQGWELPLGSRWPLGDYRIRIMIDDGKESTLTAMVPFRLVR